MAFFLRFGNKPIKHWLVLTDVTIKITMSDGKKTTKIKVDILVGVSRLKIKQNHFKSVYYVSVNFKRYIFFTVLD